MGDIGIAHVNSSHLKKSSFSQKCLFDRVVVLSAIVLPDVLTVLLVLSAAIWERTE